MCRELGLAPAGLSEELDGRDEAHPLAIQFCSWHDMFKSGHWA